MYANIMLVKKQCPKFYRYVTVVVVVVVSN